MKLKWLECLIIFGAIAKNYKIIKILGAYLVNFNKFKKIISFYKSNSEGLFYEKN